MRNDQRAIGDEVSVKPSWFELLNPEWKKAFLKWRVGKGKMPVPSKFDWWIFLYKHITIPAIRETLHFRPRQAKDFKGSMVLSEDGRFRYATFHYSRNVSKYLIGPGEIKWVSRLNGDGETYNVEPFEDLLGSKPRSKRYSFTKKAIKGNMISMGNVDGTTFVLRFPSISLPLTEGDLFFIKVERCDSSLKFRCYKSSKSKAPFAIGFIRLRQGYPISWSVSMGAPEIA